MPLVFSESPLPNLEFRCLYCPASFRYEILRHGHALFHHRKYFQSEDYQDYVQRHPEMVEVEVESDWNMEDFILKHCHYPVPRETEGEKTAVGAGVGESVEREDVSAAAYPSLSSITSVSITSSNQSLRSEPKGDGEVEEDQAGESDECSPAILSTGLLLEDVSFEESSCQEEGNGASQNERAPAKKGEEKTSGKELLVKAYEERSLVGSIKPSLGGRRVKGERKGPRKTYSHSILQRYKRKPLDAREEQCVKLQETFELKISKDEEMTIFCKMNTDDLLSCLTAKTTKTAMQCGAGVGDSGLEQENNKPRFRNRKRRSGFIKPDSYRDRRDYDRKHETFWREEEDRYREKRRVLGRSYDFRVNEMQVQTDEAVVMMQNNMHLILWKSYCGDVPINRMELFKGEAPKLKPDSKNLFVQTILRNAELRKKTGEWRRSSVPPPDPSLSSRSLRSRARRSASPSRRRSSGGRPSDRKRRREDDRRPSSSREKRGRREEEENKRRSSSLRRSSHERDRRSRSDNQRRGTSSNDGASSRRKSGNRDQKTPDPSSSDHSVKLSGGNATSAVFKAPTPEPLLSLNGFSQQSETLPLPSPTGMPTPEPVEGAVAPLPTPSSQLTELQPMVRHQQDHYARGAPTTHPPLLPFPGDYGYLASWQGNYQHNHQQQQQYNNHPAAVYYQQHYQENRQHVQVWPACQQRAGRHMRAPPRGHQQAWGRPAFYPPPHNHYGHFQGNQRFPFVQPLRPTPSQPHP